MSATVFSHVEFRPMFDFGDYCVLSCFESAEFFGVYYSPLGEPARRDEIFDDGAEALRFMLNDPKYHGIPKWLNSNEILCKIDNGPDLIHALSDMYDDNDLADLARELDIKMPKA